MIDYCMRDVDVTQRVHESLMAELEWFSRECQDLEHEVQWAISEQERNGWLLDQRKAYSLVAEYRRRTTVYLPAYCGGALLRKNRQEA
jgi:hypothetical protein